MIFTMTIRRLNWFQQEICIPLAWWFVWTIAMHCEQASAYQFLPITSISSQIWPLWASSDNSNNCISMFNHFTNWTQFTHLWHLFWNLCIVSNLCKEHQPKKNSYMGRNHQDGYPYLNLSLFFVKIYRNFKFWVKLIG